MCPVFAASVSNNSNDELAWYIALIGHAKLIVDPTEVHVCVL